MITYSTIFATVNLVLKNNFPQVNRLENSVRSGFNKPAFFVQLLPITEDAYNNYAEKLVIVNIHYFSDKKTDIDILSMLDGLNSVFVNSIAINDRTLTIGEKRYTVDDNVLQFKFTLDFVDELGLSEEQYETMEELYLESEV